MTMTMKDIFMFDILYLFCRYPDRHWSSVDELILPETSANSGEYIRQKGKAFGPERPVWSYGPRAGRRNSFYCTHISACQRLANGNTLGNI